MHMSIEKCEGESKIFYKRKEFLKEKSCLRKLLTLQKNYNKCLSHSNVIVLPYLNSVIVAITNI